MTDGVLFFYHQVGRWKWQIQIRFNVFVVLVFDVSDPYSFVSILKLLNNNWSDGVFVIGVIGNKNDVPKFPKLDEYVQYLFQEVKKRGQSLFYIETNSTTSTVELHKLIFEEFKKASQNYCGEL